MSKRIKFACVAAGIFVFLFVVMEFAYPRYFSYDDNTNFGITYEFNFNTVLQRKQVPLVNFHQYMGQTYLGQGQTGVFFLPAYVSVALSRIFTGDALWNIDILVFLFLLAAALAMYRLLLELGVSEPRACAGALLWVTMPFVFTVSRSWVFVAYMAFWIPLNFFLMLRLVKGASPGLWLLFVLLRVFMLYNGYVHYFHILFVMELIFWGICRIMNQWWSRGFFWRYLASYAVTALLSLPMLLPMYRVSALSAERGAPLHFDEITQFALTLPVFLKAQLFEFSSWVFTAPGPVFYAGIPLFLIVFLSFHKDIRKGALGKPIGVLGFCSLAAFLLSTKIYGIFSFLPTFSMFRWPCKYYLLFLFFFVAVCILIWQALDDADFRLGEAAAPVLIGISLTANAGLAFYSGDLLRYGLKYENPPDIYRQLKKEKQGYFFTGWVKDSPRFVSPMLMTGFSATQAGLYHFAGYDPLVSSVNLQNSLGLRYLAIYQQPPDAELFDLLSAKSVRYMVTENSEENFRKFREFSSLKFLYKNDFILIFENSDALPIVSFQQNPLQEVPFHFGTNEITVYPQGSGLLNISLAPIEGYRVYFDGKLSPQSVQAVPMNRGQYRTFEPVQISVPQGVQTVSLKYEDPWFTAGLILSALSLAAVLAVSAVIAVRIRKTKQHGEK